MLKKADGGYEYIFKPALKKDRKVAASSGNHQFGESTLLEGIGELYQFAEETEGHSYFQFVLTITNKQLPRPFILEIEFATVKDGKDHKIIINDNPEEPEQVIRSVPVKDIDITLGIEIIRIELRPTINNG